MKSILLANIFISVVFAEYSSLESECITSSGVDKIKVDEAREGIFAEDPKFKNFLKCILTETGTINDDGTLKKTIIKANFEKNLVAQNAALLCADIRGSDVDDTAFLNYKCFYEITKKFSS
nr:uncharacterized protein LOC111425508 [Onthophagus taurus]